MRCSCQKVLELKALDRLQREYLANWQFQQLPASHHVCCFAKEVMSLCLQEAHHCLPY